MGFFLGLIISFILNLFYSVFKFLAKVVKDILIATKLIFPVLCAIAGGILMLTGTIVYGEISFVYFALSMSLSFMLTIYLWYKALTRKARQPAGRRERQPPPQMRERKSSRRNAGSPNGAHAPINYHNNMTQGYYPRSGNFTPPQNMQIPNMPQQGAVPYPEGQLRYQAGYQQPNVIGDGFSQNHAESGYGFSESAAGRQNLQPAPLVEGMGGNPYRQHEEPGENRQMPGRFFRVKQNPRFVMRELPGKVELYEETNQGLKYIRTDLTEK